MKKIKHWSEIQKEHPEWKILITTPDYEVIVNCAGCGKEVQFAGTYTSIKCMMDNEVIGLPVCSECHFKEKREEKIENEN